jgi:hypothetical protein
MAELFNSKRISIDNSVFDFKSKGDYTIDFSKNFVQVKLDGGQNTNISDSAFSGATSFDFSDVCGLNLTGIKFTSADAASDFKFEPDTNLDALLRSLIGTEGVTKTLSMLSVNGGKADAFKLVWDHLDDNYSYYNTAINDAFIDLGIAYAQYVKNGGAPLVDTIVKYAPDGADEDATPERSQSLHDNILGNFDEFSIADKFGSGATAIIDRIQSKGFSEFIGVEGDYADGRPIYGGYDDQNPAPTIAWDVQNGYLIA